MATATPLVAQASLVATSRAADEDGWDVVVTNNLLSHQIHITDPFSSDQEANLKWYLEDRIKKDPFAEAKATAVEKSLEFYATNLYEQLKPAFTEVNLDVGSKQICLAISDRSSDKSIHRLHWEILEHPTLMCNICVYRAQEETNVEASKDLPNKKTSLNLLFMTARRMERSEADVDQRLILRPVLGFIAGISSTMPIDFDVVRPGTFEALELWLSQRKGHYDLIHFDVHGQVVNGRAQLFFASATEPEEYQHIDAEKVGNVLQNAGIRVVILNACESAVSNSGMAANLALQLLRCGVSTVIGMSYICLIRAADIFMQHFYESLLVKGTDILTSTWQARRALREERSRQARFGLNVDVDDWIVPVFYTQHTLIQDPSSDLGLDLGDLPKIPPAEWNIAKGSNDIEGTAIVGREYDALLLENALIEHSGFIHLFGNIGVGKTTLLDDVVSWWLSIKYVRSVVAVDISEFLNQPLATVLDRLRGKVKDLLGKDQHGKPDPSLTKAENKTKVPGLANANILIIIDQAEDYLRILDDENKSSFWKTLGQFHDDIKQLYPTLMIIASSCKVKGLFNEMTLEPLQEQDARDLALEISPKVLDAVRKNKKERAFCYKLAQSLGGNPLALKLVFSALEQSPTQSLSELILSIWTEGFSGQIYEHSPGLKRHFDYFLSQLEDEPSKMMIMLLSPFKGYVPKDLSIYFDRLTALEVLPARLLNSTESGFLDEAEISQKLEIFNKMVNSILAKLEGAGFVIDEDHAEDPPQQWILHPLLPYILSPKLANFSALDTERIMNAHADFYMVRAKEWKSNSPVPMEDMEQEYLNFISSFWRLSNPYGISIGTPAPWYLLKLLIIYNLGDEDEASNPGMVIAVALCKETLSRFQKSSGDWERSLTADLIYRPSGDFSEAKMKEEEHKKHDCPCKPLIVLITIGFEVGVYNDIRMTDEKALRVRLKRLIDLWNLHEKHFDDDFHYQINCGVGGKALMDAGTSYLTASCLHEALECLTRAQKLLQDSLVTYPMFQYQLRMCKIHIARTEMLIANQGSRDRAALNLREDEMAQILDEMWKSGPEIKQPDSWQDVEMRQARGSSERYIESILAKDISEPGSQEKVFKKLRKAQLRNLETEMCTNWIPGQIQSKSLMALAASRLHDWKQAQRLNEDILNLLDQEEFGSKMERRMKKLEYHIFAAQAAARGAAYEAAIQHLQKGYNITQSYKLVHDTRYNMFKILSMASFLPKDVPHQLGGLSPILQDLQLLTLLYDPTILDSEDFRKLSKDSQDKVRSDIFSTRGRMSGKLIETFWSDYVWDSTQRILRPSFSEAAAGLMGAIGASSVDFGQLIFADFSKAMGRIPAEVSNPADADLAYHTVYIEMERALFAPPELRTDFRWLDKKYEEHGLRRRWPKGYDNKAESEMMLESIKWKFLAKLRKLVSSKKNSKQTSTISSEPVTSST